MSATAASSLNPSSSYSIPAVNASQNALLLIGRILIAFLFVPAGFGKLMGFAGTVQYIASAHMPLPELGAVIAVVVELGFGLALLAGFKTRWVAPVLAIFTVAAAVIFHNFWALPEAQQMMMKIHFAKNMAIAGGLLAFAAFGPGRFSVDRR